MERREQDWRRKEKELRKGVGTFVDFQGVMVGGRIQSCLFVYQFLVRWMTWRVWIRVFGSWYELTGKKCGFIFFLGKCTSELEWKKIDCMYKDNQRTSNSLSRSDVCILWKPPTTHIAHTVKRINTVKTLPIYLTHLSCSTIVDQKSAEWEWLAEKKQKLLPKCLLSL